MINVAVSGFAGPYGFSAWSMPSTAADDMTGGLRHRSRMALRSAVRGVLQTGRAGRACRRTSMCSSTSRSPSVVEGNLRVALAAGIDCVVGTTGLANDKLEELAALAPEGTCLFYAPNFTTGAVLMMQFAKAAAPYLPRGRGARVPPLQQEGRPLRHRRAHGRRSSPRPATRRRSAAPGTRDRDRRLPREPAARWWTACPCTRCAPWAMWQARKWCSAPWARPSTIRHDSWDRTSYMPGVLLGIRSVGDRQGLIVGLENFME